LVGARGGGAGAEGWREGREEGGWWAQRGQAPHRGVHIKQVASKRVPCPKRKKEQAAAQCAHSRAWMQGQRPPPHTQHTPVAFSSSTLVCSDTRLPPTTKVSSCETKKGISDMGGWVGGWVCVCVCGVCMRGVWSGRVEPPTTTHPYTHTHATTHPCNHTHAAGTAHIIVVLRIPRSGVVQGVPDHQVRLLLQREGASREGGGGSVVRAFVSVCTWKKARNIDHGGSTQERRGGHGCCCGPTRPAHAVRHGTAAAPRRQPANALQPPCRGRQRREQSEGGGAAGAAASAHPPWRRPAVAA
jgi:hypothetical protein